MKQLHRALIITMVLATNSNPSYTQWIQQPVPSDVHLLLTTDFSNTNVGAAAGWALSFDFSGRAIYTTDGGQVWTLSQVPDSARSLVTLSFVAPQTAYIAGAYNFSTRHREHSQILDFDAPSSAPKALGVQQYLARIGLSEGGGYRGLFLVSTDAGMTWHTRGQFSDSISYMIGASFTSPSTGYVTVDAHPHFGIARILKTTDAGNSWIQLMTPDSIPSLRNISFIDSTTGVAVGYQFRNQMISGVILRTSNAGDTWYISNFPTVDNFTDVCFSNSSTGFAVGVYAPLPLRGAVFKTTDAGMTWSPLTYAPDSVLLEGVRFVNGTEVGIVYGERIDSPTLFVARTTNGGLTWTEGIIYTVPGYSLLIGGKLLSPLIGYLCGRGGFSSSAVMLHTTNGGITAIEQFGTARVNKYTLSQNYPNPFNPTTRIVFSLAQQSHVTITIFNLFGMEVQTIVSETLPSGDHSVEWNATGLPSGIYFYRMQSGLFTQTKKLLLLR
ncbi:MAG: T9SS type A sorting domain-containing protein [Bacteroidota bacterium]|nr:T9SS type A sorting domain-containing protein [Bacteroidota bacterium]